MCHTACTVILYLLDKFIIVVVKLLRYKNLFCTVCNTTPECNITGWTSHYLNYTAALMWIWCLTKSVDSFHSCIYCRVKSDSIICICNVKVYSSRKTDNINTIFWKVLSSCKWSVTTDNDKCLYTKFLTDCCCLFLSLFLSELSTSRCKKECTTMLKFLWNIMESKKIHLSVKDTIISSSDPIYFISFRNTCTHYRTNCSIHSRSISSTCQYRNLTLCLTHFIILHSICYVLSVSSQDEEFWVHIYCHHLHI